MSACPLRSVVTPQPPHYHESCQCLDVHTFRRVVVDPKSKREAMICAACGCGECGAHVELDGAILAGARCSRRAGHNGRCLPRGRPRLGSVEVSP